MTSELVILIFKILAAIGAGFLAGNGVVFLFNRIPDRWLEEKTGDQRISGYPWKGVLSATFAVIGIYLVVMEDWQYALATVTVSFDLLLIGWADRKYSRIPSPLCLLLIALSIGFLPSGDLSFPVTLIGGVILGIIGAIYRARPSSYRPPAQGQGQHGNPRSAPIPWGMVAGLAMAIYLILIHHFLPGPNVIS